MALPPYEIPEQDADLWECGVVLTRERLLDTRSANQLAWEKTRFCRSFHQVELLEMLFREFGDRRFRQSALMSLGGDKWCITTRLQLLKELWKLKVVSETGLRLLHKSGSIWYRIQQVRQ